MALVTWSGPALRDLEEIWSFIARDSEEAADALRVRMFNASEQLVAFPRSGRMVPETGSESIRELIVGSFRLIYRLILDDDVDVIAVMHGARSLDL
jgi:plasmid stabilization system protein ParE